MSAAQNKKSDSFLAAMRTAQSDKIPAMSKSQSMGEKLFRLFVQVCICIALIAFLIVIGPDHVSALIRAGFNAATAKTETVSVMAGQQFNLGNSRSIQIHVQSDFPVSIVGNGCRVFREVEVTLDCGPGTVSITDFRPALLVIGQANRITYTVRGY
jgi:hypothetical protein